MARSADPRPLAIALMGPTASGKTALALDWAQRLDGEIVSVDSALVYRGLDIGAAKPSAAEQAQVPHHLIDVRDPWQPYSAADFAQDARRALDGIVARGRLPILAGGTGLYFHALLRGLAPMPEADAAVRGQLAVEAGQRGWAALHAPRLPYRVLRLALAPAERATLHARIERRFDQMLADGFLDEVRRLRALPQLGAHPAPLDLPAIRAVGYRQAWEYLDGAGSEDEFRARGIYATRQLAKRQLTWLRGELDLRWFDPLRDAVELDRTLTQFVGVRLVGRAPAA